MDVKAKVWGEGEGRDKIMRTSVTGRERRGGTTGEGGRWEK